MLIQANISAPCTLLDFPSLDRFIEELHCHQYDVAGSPADSRYQAARRAARPGTRVERG
jgi:hypothetical protein